MKQEKMNNRIDQLAFTQNLLQAFQEKAETKFFKKGEYLTQEGIIENNLYFIEDGAVKVYYQSEFNETTIRLGYNGSIINSLSSFYSKSPSELAIEAIRETKTQVLSRSTIEEVVASSTGYTEFLELLLVQQLEREIDLLHDSPVARLERVLRRSPQLFQYVPLKHIASYLRMSAETLSRIRKSWFQSSPVYAIAQTFALNKKSWKLSNQN